MLFASSKLSLGTMVSALVSSSLIALLAVGTATTKAQTDLCRCTANFEHFYDRRRNLRDDHVEGRTLAFKNYVYDYSDYYIDDDGYYIVEGVRVLPDEDPACIEDDNDKSTTKRVFARIFGKRNLVHALELDETNQDENREQQRTLMGMMSEYTDDYYFDELEVDGYGKGKVCCCSESIVSCYTGNSLLAHFVI
jgi:hypothetical protein